MAAHPPTPKELSLDSNVSSAVQSYRDLWYVRRDTDLVKEQISYQIKTNVLLDTRALIQQRALAWARTKTSEQVSAAYTRVEHVQEARRLDADKSVHDPIVAVLNAFSIVLAERHQPLPTGPARSLGRTNRASASHLGLRQQWLYFQRRY